MSKVTNGYVHFLLKNNLQKKNMSKI